MSVEQVLAEEGFELVGERRSGDRQYSKRSNPYLAWWAVVHADGTAQLSWEFELGSYLRAKGFSVSAQDELSLLLFPSSEASGDADGQWLRAAIEGAERQLASIDLVAGA